MLWLRLGDCVNTLSKKRCMSRKNPNSVACLTKCWTLGQEIALIRREPHERWRLTYNVREGSLVLC